MTGLHEQLHGIYQEVARRNAGEIEFHQAVYEVLDSLGPVVSRITRPAPTSPDSSGWPTPCSHSASSE
jgi:hypothetical protein